MKPSLLNAELPALALLTVLLILSPGFSQTQTVCNFTGRQIYPITHSVFAPGIGDFDGDGDLDVIGINDETLTLFLNRGNGQFESMPPLPTGKGFGFSGCIAVDDFDGDQDLDFVFSSFVFPDLRVFLNDGNAHFVEQDPKTLEDQLSAVIPLDIDNDGDADLAYLDDAGLRLLKNSGNAEFVFQDPIVIENPDVVSLTSADFDDDGDLDLAVCAAGVAIVFYNDGNGNFPDRAEFETGNLPRRILADDFDDDGKIDLVTANFGTSSENICVLFNAGGVFEPPVHYGIPLQSTADRLASGDFDGDSHIDIVVSDIGNQNFSIFRNLGDGTFALTESFELVTTPNFMAGVHLDSDPSCDLLTLSSSFNASQISVFKSGCNDAVQFEQIIEGPGFRGQVLDWDSDGDQDLMAYGTGIQIWINDGAGNFDSGPVFDISASRVELADMDDDGDQDLVIRAIFDQAIVLFRESDELVQKHSPTSIPELEDMSVGDVDNDGDTDLIAATEFGQVTTVRVFLNNGQGELTETSETYEIDQSNFNDLEACDLNGDGSVELMTSHLNGGINVLVNDGTGLFPIIENYPIGVSLGLTIGDVNGDDLKDIVLTSAAVLFNQGNTEFEFCESDLSFNVGPDQHFLADIDGDNDLDLVMGDDAIAVVINEDGQFTEYCLWAVSGTTNLLQPIDIDGNGSIDLAAFKTNEISLLHNSSYKLGDVNLDGRIDLLDVQPFVSLLQDVGFQKEADLNFDGVVDLLDVTLFVLAITQN